MMTKPWRSIVVAAPLLCAGSIGCSSPELVPPGSEFTEVFSTKLTAAELTVYSVRAGVDQEELIDYPVLPADWREHGWKVKKWGQALAPDELSVLAEFLSDQREIFADGGGLNDEVQALNTVVRDLARWPVDGVFLSYMYKEQPGSDEFVRGGSWLYVYHYSTMTDAVTAVTNAFR